MYIKGTFAEFRDSNASSLNIENNRCEIDSKSPWNSEESMKHRIHSRENIFYSMV